VQIKIPALQQGEVRISLWVEVVLADGFAVSDMDVIQHETVQFYGRVQGVGFRYATLQIAKEFEVTGFVRNQPDGSVWLEVQGKSAELGQFLEAIEERMHGYIRRTARTVTVKGPIYSGFEIR
jgi:acylphosphatase